MTNLERALMVAEQAHRNQTYDIYPYHYHIKMVVKVSQDLGYDESIQVACALHDTLEDTDLSYNDLKKAFGIEVADLVFNVTDELGRNRKERKMKTYPKIKSNWKSIAVKLCDRIANMQHSNYYNPHLFEMYKNEKEDFKKELITDHSELKRAWEKLDNL